MCSCICMYSLLIIQFPQSLAFLRKAAQKRVRSIASTVNLECIAAG